MLYKTPPEEKPEEPKKDYYRSVKPLLYNDRELIIVLSVTCISFLIALLAQLFK
jgi:hypothetical protein